jgi:hypothetical protein
MIRLLTSTGFVYFDNLLYDLKWIRNSLLGILVYY